MWIHSVDQRLVDTRITSNISTVTNFCLSQWFSHCHRIGSQGHRTATFTGNFFLRMWQASHHRRSPEADSGRSGGQSRWLALPCSHPRRSRGGVLLCWSAGSWSMGFDSVALCREVSKAQSPHCLSLFAIFYSISGVLISINLSINIRSKKYVYIHGVLKTYTGNDTCLAVFVLFYCW